MKIVTVLLMLYMNVVLKYLIANHNIRVLVIRNNPDGTIIVVPGIAKNRVGFWLNIWYSCHRPREGYVYLSYKSAKKTYGKVCNMAVNVKIYSEFNTISNLHLCKRSGKMWNLIRTLGGGGGGGGG